MSEQMEETGNLESFDDYTADAEVDGGLDTFDDGDYTTGVIEEENVEQPREEVSTESQVSQLDESEESQEGEKSDTEPQDEDKEDGEEPKQDDKADEPEGESEKGADEEPIKTLKAFRGDKAYEVPKDAEVKVKIDGKNVKVPIQELMDNYSGQQAYDKKFSALNEDRKIYEQEFKQYNEQRTALASELQEVKRLAQEGLEGKVSPLEFVDKMLDQMGADSYTFNKVLRSYLAEETALLNQLSPEQQNAYWVQKENEYLVKKQESLRESMSQRQSQAELETKLANLREAHGVSQEVYSDSYRELTDMGYSDATPEQIIEYSVNKPLAQEAVRLLEPYTDQLDDAQHDGVIQEIMSAMKNGTSSEEVAQLLMNEYKVETVSSLVEEKAAKRAPEVKRKEYSPTAQMSYESFDDFEDDNGYNEYY